MGIRLRSHLGSFRGYGEQKNPLFLNHLYFLGPVQGSVNLRWKKKAWLDFQADFRHDLRHSDEKMSEMRLLQGSFQASGAGPSTQILLPGSSATRL
jgi:hypothetical protein